MTNVKAKDLNYDHYEMTKYDSDIIRSIPGHEKMHKEIDKMLFIDFVKKKTEKNKPIKILELGIGTGVTASRILKLIPTAEYTAIDFSKNMFEGAKKKLKKYNVKFVFGDFTKIILPKTNLVVSVIGIHHQETDKDKKKLFKRIYKSLNKNGIFIFGDLVTYKDKETAALNDAKHYQYLMKNAKDEKSLKEWVYHHKFLNKLAPVEDQIKWLKEIGFKKVKLIYKKYNTALIYAKK